MATKIHLPASVQQLIARIIRDQLINELMNPIMTCNYRSLLILLPDDNRIVTPEIHSLPDVPVFLAITWYQ